MKRAILLTTMAFVGWIRAAGAMADEAADIATERKMLDGEWSIVSVELDGAPVPVEQAGGIQFTGDKMLIAGEGKAVPRDYWIDVAKSPKWIDLDSTLDAKVSVPAIYQLNGDKLTICAGGVRTTVTPSGERVTSLPPRPTSFDSKQGVLYRFERKRPTTARR